MLADVGSLAHQLRQEDWQRLSMSQGTKGERLFDWAILPWLQAGTLDGRHFLVFRRCLDDPHELAYYLVFAPLHTPLSTIVQAIGARWSIEEDLQASKDLGLDQYESRSYLAWYRHLTLVMLAYAFLVAICVQENFPPPGASASPAALPAPAGGALRSTALQPAPKVSPAALPAPALIPLTTSEVHHLLARLFFPAPTSAPLICHWSWWRRAHQYWAGYYHRRRRHKGGSALRSLAMCLA